MLNLCAVIGLVLSSIATPAGHQARIDEFASTPIWQQVHSDGDGLVVVAPNGTLSLYYDVRGTEPLRRQVLHLVPHDPRETLGLGISSYTGRVIVNGDRAGTGDERGFNVQVLLPGASDGAGLEFVWQMSREVANGNTLVIAGQCVELVAWHTDEAFGRSLMAECGVELAGAERTWPLMLGAANLMAEAAGTRKKDSACTNCSAGGKGSSSCSITENGSTRSASCKSGRYACCKEMEDGSLSAKCCQPNGTTEVNAERVGPADDVNTVTFPTDAIHVVEPGP